MSTIPTTAVPAVPTLPPLSATESAGVGFSRSMKPLFLAMAKKTMGPRITRRVSGNCRMRSQKGGGAGRVLSIGGDP